MNTSTQGIPLSQLPAATLPLTGTELTVVVQGGQMKRAPASSVGASGIAALVRWTLTAAAAVPAGVTNDLGTDITNANRLLVTPAGDATITGLAGGAEGQIVVVQNLSAVFLLTLPQESVLSAAGNRWAVNGDLIIPPRCGAAFMRDLANVNRWVKL